MRSEAEQLLTEIQEEAGVEQRLERRAAEQRAATVSGEERSGELAYGFELRKGEKRGKGDRGEDCFLVDGERKLVAVADGLGGERGGKGAEASAAAVELLPGIYDKIRKGLRVKGSEHFATEKDLIELVRGQVIAEDGSDEFKRQFDIGWKELAAQPPAVQNEIVALWKTVRELAEEVKKTGGQTTLTVGRMVELPGRDPIEVIASVGDSGAVKVREDGSAADLIGEHSLVDTLVSKGLITPEQAKDPSTSLEHVPGVSRKFKTVGEARKAMTMSLGGDVPVNPKIAIAGIRPGERLAFVTDGYKDEYVDSETGEFLPQNLANVLKKEKSPKAAAERAGKAAAKGGKKFDDKAIVVIERAKAAGAVEAA